MSDPLHREFIRTSAAVDIHAAVAGEGPPVVLLHGYPQTHVMWHRIAPALAERFTCVMPDLRGYGDSSKPAGDSDHSTYSKRALAQDMVEVMDALGFQRFAVVGHDRGARVGHRMALDWPDEVERLAILDIVPTLTIFERVDRTIATEYYHWFFLIQPGGLPERLIGADPEFYLDRKLHAWGTAGEIFSPEARAEYLRCFRDPATIHATCEDYRAGASIDLEHDRADRDARIDCPVLVLWGSRGLMERNFDVLATWREKARQVEGRAIVAGHFLAEEAPDETLAALLPFLES